MRSGFSHMLYTLHMTPNRLLLTYLFTTFYIVQRIPLCDQLITDQVIIALSLVWMWITEWLKLDHYQANQNHY